MAQINLSAWAIRHSTLMHFFMLLVALAGVHAYFALGQDEDPPFTVRTMVVRAYLPGATIDETMRELTDRIEKKLEETPYLDYLKSYTTPGEATIFVNLLSGTPQSEVPECWYQVRKKVGDISYTLPSETVGPYFDDEFGDTYGIIYAFTADGFTHRELKDYVEEIRKKLLSLQYVGKITTIGEQDEKYYVEFSPHRLAKLGISQNAVMSAIQQQNALTPSGTVDTDSDKIAIESSGRFHSESDIANVTLYAGSQKIRLGDVATVTHGYADPPTPHFRCNGKDAIGLAINMSKGGNVLKLKENVENAMARILADLPVGIETTLVANQPAVVHDSVNEFTEALFEAVAIVLGVSFLSLGLRADNGLSHADRHAGHHSGLCAHRPCQKYGRRILLHPLRHRRHGPRRVLVRGRFVRSCHRHERAPGPHFPRQDGRFPLRRDLPQMSCLVHAPSKDYCHRDPGCLHPFH